MPDSKRDWWEVEFEQMVTIDVPDFRSDIAALEYVQKVRALNDPAFKPVALIHVKQLTTTTSERHPLDFEEADDVEEILAAVKKKLLEQKGVVPDGEDGLAWAVRATLEARRPSNAISAEPTPQEW